MKKIIIGLFLCIATVQASNAQAKLPNDASKTPTKQNGPGWQTKMSTL